jgi:hypothetical protein
VPLRTVFLLKPSKISFAESMSQLRTWFDHKKIQPTWFRLREGEQTGFEISFQSDADASAFDTEFAWQAAA